LLLSIKSNHDPGRQSKKPTAASKILRVDTEKMPATEADPSVTGIYIRLLTPLSKAALRDQT
jgi:hypothetical protein